MKPEWKYKQILDRIGSAAAITTRLQDKGYQSPPEETIQGWKTRNSIPGKWVPVILELAFDDKIIKNLIKNLNDLKLKPLTSDIEIPTAARLEVRRFVKKQPEWDDWRELFVGKPSRNVTNKELIDFALVFGYGSKLLGIINKAKA
jgi:hypothetical protein